MNLRTTKGQPIAVYCDPPSHHFFKDRLFDMEFASHGGDKLLAPYAYLKSFLNAQGISIHTSDHLKPEPNGDLNVFVSFGRLNGYETLAKRNDVVLSAFFAMECPTVDPRMYRELNKAQHFFNRVFSWSDSRSLEGFVGGELKCLPLRWPQSFESVHEEIWRRTDRGFMVMINGNKLPRYPPAEIRELYSERMRALEALGRTGDIELYGVGWDGPTFKVGPSFVPGTFEKVPLPGTVQRIHRYLLTNWQRIFPEPRLVAARKVYRGFSTSKSETLGKYKFALCFENSILKGWVTEKIFDCLFAGTVPVYWGAPDIADYVPHDCFIDMRDFKDYSELQIFLKSLSEAEIAGYKERAKAFLSSPRFQPFTKQAFAQLFARMIEEDAGVKLNKRAVSAVG